MYRLGHFGVALIAYAPLAFVLLVSGFGDLAIVGGVGAVGLAMVPDYDQRIPGISHRGPTHTVWFAVLVGSFLGTCAGFLGSTQGAVVAAGLTVFGFLVGTITVLSHIAADALTPAGVRPFSPVSNQRYTYDLTAAKNPLANYGLLGLGALVSLVVFVVGSAIGRYVSQLG